MCCVVLMVRVHPLSLLSFGARNIFSFPSLRSKNQILTSKFKSGFFFCEREILRVFCDMCKIFAKITSNKKKDISIFACNVSFCCCSVFLLFKIDRFSHLYWSHSLYSQHYPSLEDFLYKRQSAVDQVVVNPFARSAVVVVD